MLTVWQVSLEKRIEEFPDQSLIISATTKGRILFCQCCAKELQNLKETIKTHVVSERHKGRYERWMKKHDGDSKILKFLHEYFRNNPSEKNSTIGEETQIHRWRVVETCLHAGIALHQVDNLRHILEKGGYSLPASSHLGQYIPKIEQFEFDRITEEVAGRKVCLIYDGTTRLGEVTAVLARWCSDSFMIEQRLIALRTVKRHMNGEGLGSFLIDVIAQLGIRSQSVVCTARDSCSTNAKAERSIQPILIQSTSMLCVSHTLSHTAEHVELPVLKEFMTPWLSLVQHHPSAKSKWKEMLGTSMKGYSTIRWFSREELCNELAENFGMLKEFVDYLVRDEIGDAHPKKMCSILDSQGEALQLELACNLDMKPVIKACYGLEGDGLTVLLARRKIDSLLAWGATVGDESHSMPNVAAVLRAKVKLEPGVKIYEYFADVQPPKWFKGTIVPPRTDGLITVKYEDNSQIDQEEREARQWVDVRQMPEWIRLAEAAKAGITYLRNRMTGNLPAAHMNYDCSRMFAVLDAVQIFDPSWAAQLSNQAAISEAVDKLRLLKSLEEMVDKLKNESAAYITAASKVTIDHTETVADHSFTNGVLKFFSENHGTDSFPTWIEAAKVVFAFTPASAAAERVFSLLNCMYGEDQIRAKADGIQAGVMLRYNKRLGK